MPDALTLAPSGATQIDPAVIERVIIHGDLRQLTPQQKVSYYNAVCNSVGLNPLTQPFQYLVLSGREVLYARREATDQLRHLHNVSVEIMAREVMEDCYIVTARATLPEGRTDESIGAVPIASLKGEFRANAMMKAETKAKRRVTLAICGLGMLDETEIPGVVEQARPDFVTEATAIADQYEAGDEHRRVKYSQLDVDAQTKPLHVEIERLQQGRSAPAAPAPALADDNDARDQIEVHEFPAERLARLATGVVLITKLDAVPTKNPNVIRTTITVAGNASWPANQTRLTTINETLAARAESAWHREQAVLIRTTKGKFGYELAGLEDAHEGPQPLSPSDALPDRGDPDIPF
jgi:hypothetical protein